MICPYPYCDGILVLDSGMYQCAMCAQVWSAWHLQWIERLVDAETKLSAELAVVRELKAKVKTW